MPKFGENASSILSEFYSKCKCPDMHQLQCLAQQCKLSLAQVANWFERTRHLDSVNTQLRYAKEISQNLALNEILELFDDEPASSSHQNCTPNVNAPFLAMDNSLRTEMTLTEGHTVSSAVAQAQGPTTTTDCNFNQSFYNDYNSIGQVAQESGSIGTDFNGFGKETAANTLNETTQFSGQESGTIIREGNLTYLNL